MRCWLIVVMATVGCSAGVPPPPIAPRYVVTATPVDVGLGAALCVAVDRADAAGVWWWRPGETGCATRSTGPAVFRAEGASVGKPGADETWTASFKIPTQSTVRPVIEVRMVVGEREIRVVTSDSRVAAVVRHDLNIPEDPIRGRGAANQPPADPAQIRTLLEHRYQGMSGEGAILKIAPTVAEVEASAKDEMKAWHVPINYWETPEWTEFRSGARAGDTLVYFRNNSASWKRQGGAEGYAIVRHGELVLSFLIAQS